MTPALRLMQAFREQQADLPPAQLLELAQEGDEAGMGEDAPDTPEDFKLGLRKKRIQAMLKQMMANAGYGGLAKNTQISRTRAPEEGEEENVY